MYYSCSYRYNWILFVPSAPLHRCRTFRMKTYDFHSFAHGLSTVSPLSSPLDLMYVKDSVTYLKSFWNSVKRRNERGDFLGEFVNRRCIAKPSCFH